MPVAVKDFYDTAGIRTTAHSEHFANRVHLSKTRSWSRRGFVDAAAVLVGKTNMHKLGMGDNLPRERLRTGRQSVERLSRAAGSSSGSSAASVAAGLCFATVDTDAISSGRLPAAICGVTYHKPTFGLLSTTGILAGEKVDPAISFVEPSCVMALSARRCHARLQVLINSPHSGAALPHRILQDPLYPVRRVGAVTNLTASDDIRRSRLSLPVSGG